MWSITGGHKLRVSSDSILERVLASVSSRWTRFSAFCRRHARRFQLGASHVVRGFSGNRRGFRFSQRGLRAFERSSKRDTVGALQRRQFALDRLDLGGNPGDALVLLACGVFETVALRGEVGKRLS